MHKANTLFGIALRAPVPPKYMVRALVWFWIIDETLVLTSILSVCRLNGARGCPARARRPARSR
jgi:hypothetical protein